MRKLGPIRGLAILAVVISHAPYYGMLALSVGWWGYRFGESEAPADWSWVGTWNYYVLVGMNQLGLFSVPAFLFASGFFVCYVGRRRENSLTLSTVRGWLKSLLYPYLIWIIISVFMYIMLVKATGRPFELENLVQRRVLDYFFVLLMAQLYVLSPLLSSMALKRPGLLLLLSVLLQESVTAMHYLQCVDRSFFQLVARLDLWGWLLFPQWQLYFVMGLLVAQYQSIVVRRLARVNRQLVAVALVFGLLSVVETGFLHHIDLDYMNNHVWKVSTQLYSATAILCFFTWEWPRGRVSSALDQLGLRSYGVYLVQPIALDYASKMTYVVAPQFLSQQLIFQPLLVAAGIGVPLLLMATAAKLPLHSCQRQVQRFVFG